MGTDRLGVRSPGPCPALGVTLSISITSRPTFDPASVGLACWSPVGRAGRGSCRGSIQRRRGHIMVALTRDMRQTSMFSERKDHAYVCRIGWPCWRVTLVAQRATEVTDMPGVPRQPGWVRPEGGAPSETRASGYEPFDHSAASRARITGRGAGGIGGQHRRRADPL